VGLSPDHASTQRIRLNDEEELAPPQREPKKRVWPFLLAFFLAILAAWPAFKYGYVKGEQDERLRDAAAEAAIQRGLPPFYLYCPLPNSQEGLGAIRKQPLVTVTKPPVQKFLVMRKAVVVIVDVKLTEDNDVVICGNDAALVLKQQPDELTRFWMEGGTDKGPQGGPVVYVVDDVFLDPERVWFTNGKPQIVRCFVKLKPTPEMPRPCASYYAEATPSPTRRR
jgi:hypothetical protein